VDEKWEKVHQVKEKKIKPQAIKLVDDAEIIHIIVESDFAQVVVLERLLNCVSMLGGTENVLSMEIKASIENNDAEKNILHLQNFHIPRLSFYR